MIYKHQVGIIRVWISLVCVFLLVPIFPQSAHATVTWSGVNGVSAKFFQVNCTGCHASGSGQTPYWTDYPTVKANLSCILTRINGGACGSGSGFMPPSASTAIAHTLVDQWQTDGIVLDAQPSVVTNAASSINKVQATFAGSVNANGLATQYWFAWGLDDSGNNFPSETDHQATADTNGGVVPQSVSSLLGSLTCGTAYQFRAAASNADNALNTPTLGAVKYFSTAACNFPMVAFGGSTVAGVGDAVTLPIALTVDGSTDLKYPITIHYEILGTAAASDYVLSSNTLSINSSAHTVTINAGQTGDLALQIAANSKAPANATVVMNLTSVTSSNATLPNPPPSTYTVVITGNGSAPIIPLQVSQTNTPGIHSQYVYKNMGNVTVTANPGSGGNQLSYNWSATDSRLLNAGASVTGNQFTFNPLNASVTPGAYVVAVATTDGQVTIHHTTTLWVGSNAPVLSCTPPNDDQNGNGICDAVEGYGDFDGDGLPDYLDPTSDPTLLNEAVTNSGTNLTRLITTTAGLSLALDDAAIAAVGSGTATGARIPASMVSDDPGYSIVSGVYDFQIRGLTPTQPTARVVIPLERPMPSNAVYRKFNRGVWSDFVATATDGIRSAASVNNQCPPPGSTSYVAGLATFNDCIELTLTDGGPNDADAEANGVISDPGAVVIPAAANDNGAGAVPTSAPGGAGALDWWWLAMMSSLLAFRNRSRLGKEA